MRGSSSQLSHVVFSAVIHAAFHLPLLCPGSWDVFLQLLAGILLPSVSWYHRLLMGMWMSTGPSTDPSQMSLVTSLHCEKRIIYRYLVSLPQMQLLTHEGIFPLIPCQISFFMSPWWQVLLKAFQKLGSSYRADRSNLQPCSFLWSRKRVVEHSFIAPRCKAPPIPPSSSLQLFYYHGF